MIMMMKKIMRIYCKHSTWTTEVSYDEQEKSIRIVISDLKDDDVVLATTRLASVGGIQSEYYLYKIQYNEKGSYYADYRRKKD